MFTAPITRALPDNGIDSVLRRPGVARAHAAERCERQAQLLVLSRNPELVEVVRTAAQSAAHVAHARDLDDAARSLSHIDPGVLLLDGAITSDIALTLTQIARRFPDVVMVVVGSREESNELMQLAAAGRIFRFLLMPLSFGPVRLALAAAVTQHLERKVANRRLASVPPLSGRSRQWRVLAYVALSAALLITLGGLWRVVQSQAAKPVIPAVLQAPREQPALTRDGSLLMAQLQRATEAMAQGHYLEPAGSSALELYRGVLQLDSNSAAAREGIRAIADEFMLRAEQALVAESLEDAQRILTLVRSIEAGHPRLTFLDSRLARERELRNLSQRRDAGNRVRQLVGEARNEMLSGNLVGTGNGGAAAALLAARKLDPDDASVKQSLLELNTALADAARMAMSAGDAQRAQIFTNAARRLGAGDQLLAAIERSVKETKRSVLPPPVVTPPAPVPVTPIVGPSGEAPLTVGTVDPRPVPTLDEVLQAADLPRIKQVMPAYPPDAALQGLEGYVDLEFTINTDGVPRNLTVVSATPKRVFDRAAMLCVRQWRFEPIKLDGVPVARRALLRVRFQLR